MPDDPPDEQKTDDYLTALRADLKAYDNPEVFEDNKLPQVYKLRVVNTLLPNAPTVINIELHGDVLFSALRESTFAMFRHNPETERQMLEAYGAEDWSKVRAEILADEEFQGTELAMLRFFVRNFPKLMVSLYNITNLVSVFSALGNLFTSPAERNQREQLFRTLLKNMLRLLEKDIKQMLETRSSGRPVKVEKGPVPEILRRVCLAGFGLMSGRKGKDAVPALKGVALALDMSEAALRKQLTRAGYPWRLVKIHLETFDLEPPANSE